LTITNTSSQNRENEMIYIPETKLKAIARKFNAYAFVVFDGEKEIPSQYNFNDHDYPGIIFVLDGFKKNESRKITIRYKLTGIYTGIYAKKTQAELSHKVGGTFVNREYKGGEFKNVDFLRVPPEHKDHSWFIRYEGPGWESDKIGYRLYLDARNANDTFGKSTDAMVLQHVGMDVMKVGKSLGLGTLAVFKDGHAIRIEKTDSVTCRITENGNVFSSVTTLYYGWNVGDHKSNLSSRISIHAGTRLSHQRVTATGALTDFCTGIGKDTTARVLKFAGDEHHLGYIASYGKQSLNNDNLGMAVFFRPNNFAGFAEDPSSHIVKMTTSDGQFDYYFMAAWEGEVGGIKTREAFINYLTATAGALAEPLNITYSKK
jgi:hypothetical protein